MVVAGSGRFALEYSAGIARRADRGAGSDDARRSRGEMSNVTFQPEERARSYKKLEEDAIALARESRWEEAAEKNRELLTLYSDDVSGYNRLGKALSELGHYAEAREAY